MAPEKNSSEQNDANNLGKLGSLLYTISATKSHT